MSDKKQPGTIGWIDLTVKNATAVRDFYAQVTGWNHSSIDMGGYEDFCMNQIAEVPLFETVIKATNLSRE